MPEVVVTEPGGTARALTAPAGATILDLARREDLALEGTCGGQMACATCHVVIAAEWYGRLPTPSAEERDMLELAARPRRTSRLGCQVRLTPDLDGLAFTVIGE
ncbi:MAG: 2Fe-2S iron-sulfur cluster binding domain-containing protein [Alphaproteobacteria bacterium]|nr:2Fe-2S iron-sulfur cluster binding domain-containing protein [Alphaproteobacteria bacterium]